MLRAVGALARSRNRRSAFRCAAIIKPLVLGRPATTTPEQRVDIMARHKAGASISELSRLHGVSHATVMRIARPEGAQA
jgi:hypothetical protein